MEKPKTHLEEAQEDLAEKVSVAGWKEALAEKIIWIRRIFQIGLFILSICAIYYCVQVIIKYTATRHSYKDEVTEFAEQEELPFTNVTICAQVYFKKSVIKTNVVVPDDVAQQYVKETGNSMDEFYEQLTLFLAYTIRPRKFVQTMMRYFLKVLRNNPQIRDYQPLLLAAYPTCKEMIKRCWFNGKAFDCCERAVQVVDSDGICYLIALNHDSDNAAPSSLTQSQKRPGPSGGLTVEASLSGLDDFPWLDDNIAENGFKVYVNAVPYADMQSPLGAPHRAETFIKVVSTKRVLSANCAPLGHLSIKSDVVTYYDPEGFGCGYSAFESLIYKWVSCHISVGFYRPNISITCQPATEYVLSTVLTQDFSNSVDDLTSLVSLSTDKLQTEKTLSEFERDFKAVFSSKSICASHCNYWTYSSTASFFYLEKDDNTKNNESTMFSKIHVYYGDFGYRQYEEAKETTIYLAFCDFGNVVGFYWGMSIISFFHVAWYVTRYLVAFWKERQGDKTRKLIRVTKNIRVAPINRTEL